MWWKSIIGSYPRITIQPKISQLATHSKCGWVDAYSKQDKGDEVGEVEEEETMKRKSRRSWMRMI